MKAEVEIVAMHTKGDSVAVQAQGKFQASAPWRPMGVFHLELPEYAGQKLHIGQSLILEVKPKRGKK